MAPRFCFCFLLAALTLLAPQSAAPQAAAQTSQEPSSDDIVYDQVRQVLTFDADVRGGAIEVIVKNGDVVLRGRVRDEKAREKAAKLAKKVKGVKSVKNELRLASEK